MNDRKLEIELTRQILTVLDGDRAVQTFPVSTSRFGPGERFGSLCTPRGTHAVRAKVGADQPQGAVFVGRRFTDEIYNDDLAREHPGRDWILTRLVWLTGREPGRNRGGTVDTLRRYIYIHGTPDTEPMGVPASHGCIRMRNRDMIDLFNLVEPGNIVEIVP